MSLKRTVLLLALFTVVTEHLGRGRGRVTQYFSSPDAYISTKPNLMSRSAALKIRFYQCRQNILFVKFCRKIHKLGFI